MRQTMVDSWYCLDRVVPEKMSSVSRRSEVGNHKQRTPNTWSSSGTSAGTFAVSLGTYINYYAEAGTKNEHDTFFVLVKTKGWKIGFQVSNLSSLFFPFLFRSTLKTENSDSHEF